MKLELCGEIHSKKITKWGIKHLRESFQIPLNICYHKIFSKEKSSFSVNKMSMLNCYISNVAIPFNCMVHIYFSQVLGTLFSRKFNKKSYDHKSYKSSKHNKKENLSYFKNLLTFNISRTSYQHRSIERDATPDSKDTHLHALTFKYINTIGKRMSTYT